MKKKEIFHFVLLILAVLIGLSILYIYQNGVCRNAEGFKDKEELSASNVIVDVISKMKHMSGYLTDMSMWKDRIEMFQMSPVDLARRELNKKSEGT